VGGCGDTHGPRRCIGPRGWRCRRGPPSSSSLPWGNGGSGVEARGGVAMGRNRYIGTGKRFIRPRMTHRDHEGLSATSDGVLGAPDASLTGWALGRVESHYGGWDIRIRGFDPLMLAIVEPDEPHDRGKMIHSVNAKGCCRVRAQRPLAKAGGRKGFKFSESNGKGRTQTADMYVK